MKQELTLLAPAKINLTLDILRRREDGYHDLQMVMQTVSLCDTVTVRTGTGGGLSVATDRADLPGGPGNLAWKAAENFYDAMGLPNEGTEIFLKKRIPMEAGMAGGSADAAAVLRALRALLRPGLPDAALERMAARVGSDVPFCVRGGTALAEGRGEVLTALPPLPPCHILLCKPGFGISTPALFGRVRVEDVHSRPNLPAMLSALSAGDLPGIAAQMRNVFEDVLAEEREAIFAIRDTMRRHGALSAMMTGSGTTVFGLFSEEDAARQAAAALKQGDLQVFLVKPFLN